MNASIANPRRGRQRRGGVLTVELVLTLPILLVVLLAIVEYSMLLMSSQGVSAAASVGAREAALPSATALSVQNAIDQALAGWSFAASAQVEIRVNDQPEAMMPLASAMTGDVILVSVQVPSVAAVPDMLQFIGLSIQGELLIATFVTRRE